MRTKKKTVEEEKNRNSQKSVKSVRLMGVYGGKKFWKRYVFSLEWKSEGVMDDDSVKIVKRMKVKKIDLDKADVVKQWHWISGSQYYLTVATSTTEETTTTIATTTEQTTCLLYTSDAADE